MNEKRRHFTKKGIIFLTVMFVIVYFISFISLFDCGHFPFVPKWFWGRAGLFVIVGVSVAWIFLMRVLTKTSMKIKIALIILGLAVISAVLTWWIIENSSISIHIFG